MVFLELVTQVVPVTPHRGFTLTDLIGLLGGMVAFVSLIGTVVYTRSFVKAKGVKAQLDAKDEVIGTNEQTIYSFEKRINALEEELTRVAQEAKVSLLTIADLKMQLHEALEKYRQLEQYAAPEAFQILNDNFSAHLTKLEEIMSASDSSRDDVVRQLLAEFQEIKIQLERLVTEAS